MIRIITLRGFRAASSRKQISIHAAAVAPKQSRRAQHASTEYPQEAVKFRGPRVILKSGKARLFQEGHPLVYGGAVDDVLGSPKTGDAVLVTDSKNNSVGWGFFNADSMFRVRIMQPREEFSVDTHLDSVPERAIRERIEAAVALRRTLQLPSETTTAYRLINSEGDHLSGLIADVYGQHLVVASSAAWVEKYKPLLHEILGGLPGISSMSWKPSVSMLNEEGVILPPLERPADDDSQEDADTSNASAAILENGVQFTVPLVGGQKTGFYADQRDSRAYIRGIARGARVLDLCCYTGGFAISAALGGALHVTGVDSSAAALALAAGNCKLNHISEEQYAFEQGDIAEFMRSAHEAGKEWDVVILDPPKLAPNRKSLPRATGKYQRLNTAAMRLVRPGGLLMTCSCSGAMTQSGDFQPMLKAAATAARRKLAIVRHAGPGPDHPLNPAYPEGQYLTNVLLSVR